MHSWQNVENKKIEPPHPEQVDGPILLVLFVKKKIPFNKQGKTNLLRDLDSNQERRSQSRSILSVADFSLARSWFA